MMETRVRVISEMDTEAFLASLKVLVTEEIADGVIEMEDGTTRAAGASTFRLGEGVPFRVVTQKYGKGIVEYSTPCDAQGKMYIEVDLAKPAREQGKTIDGYIGVAADALKDSS